MGFAGGSVRAATIAAALSTVSFAPGRASAPPTSLSRLTKIRRVPSGRVAYPDNEMAVNSVPVFAATCPRAYLFASPLKRSLSVPETPATGNLRSSSSCFGCAANAPKVCARVRAVTRFCRDIPLTSACTSPVTEIFASCSFSRTSFCASDALPSRPAAIAILRPSTSASTLSDSNIITKA